MLEILYSEHGSAQADPSSPNSMYDHGTAVTLTAMPDDYYEFDYWSGDIPSADRYTNPVVVNMTSMKTVSANFKPLFGTIKVNIEPQDAVTAGAKWRRVGASVWRDSGSAITGIPAGDHQIEFKLVTDWQTPAKIPVSIVDASSKNIEVTGTYSQYPGGIKVTIDPAQANTDGAGWRRVGASTGRLPERRSKIYRLGSKSDSVKSLSNWYTPQP